jgi:hypothetical protein
MSACECACACARACACACACARACACACAGGTRSTRTSRAAACPMRSARRWRVHRVPEGSSRLCRVPPTHPPARRVEGPPLHRPPPWPRHRGPACPPPRAAHCPPSPSYFYITVAALLPDRIDSPPACSSLLCPADPRRARRDVGRDRRRVGPAADCVAAARRCRREALVAPCCDGRRSRRRAAHRALPLPPQRARRRGSTGGQCYGAQCAHRSWLVPGAASPPPPLSPERTYYARSQGRR